MSTRHRRRFSRWWMLVAGVVWFLEWGGWAGAATNDYAAVAAILNRHCLDCHASQEPEGRLVLESHAGIMQGGESGQVVVAGQSQASLLVKVLEEGVERKGKKVIMPPGKRPKLTASEVATLRAWIDAGAIAPAGGDSIVRELMTPKIVPKTPPTRGIRALAHSAQAALLAVGRDEDVELFSAEFRVLVGRLSGHRGNVNALAFSPDGRQLFAAAGPAGLFGEVRQWNVSDRTLVRVIDGHRDAIYGLAIAPDGSILATGGYDQKIKLWAVDGAKELRTLSGHNGAVYDLTFRPDGKILASASADRTVKLWDVATGERRETLSQPLKEIYTVAFSPDGKRLVAGGVDNRIRVWQISATAAETTNPILESRFAHEGAILKIAYSSDGRWLLSSAEDRTVKIWEATEVKEKVALERPSDWPTALTFALSNRVAVVGCLDGTLRFHDVQDGKILPPPKPELQRAEPRGLQRGVTTRIRLVGSNLVGLTNLIVSQPGVPGQFVHADSENPREAWISVTPPVQQRRGPLEIAVAGVNGESGKISIHIDDLPQQIVGRGEARNRLITGQPVSLWSVHEKAGDTEWFHLDARAGQTIVFDVAAKSFGSKSELVLTLTDAQGKMLATNGGFDGGSDPLLAYTFSSDGRYALRVHELMQTGSTEHFYRLSVGELPYVVGCSPLSVAANTETGVELIGFNLPPMRSVIVKADRPGEMDVPIDAEKFRSRRTFKVQVTELPEVAEVEPNDGLAQATLIPAPASVNGRIGSKDRPTDSDLFRFDARAGELWVIETVAGQRGSPIDTKIEVLSEEGRPVPRLQLQAVRNSAVTFRGIDSNSADCRVENWEEMELNQYLYLQGEVVKLFRAPQGPDSGFVFYTSNGRRRNYFDTSATTHANEEPCYIVEPHPPNARLRSTGLPVFPLTYVNDDDGDRWLGTDSKLTFTAPADGPYWIRVTDSRGAGGERFVYRLVLRKARPDFEVTLNGANPTVSAGSGQGFSVSARRFDGFEGEIRVEVAELPRGFSVSSPLIIEAGHNEAKGTINAAEDAPDPAGDTATNSVVTATARVEGCAVTKRVNHFGRIRRGGSPKLYVNLEVDPDQGGQGKPAGLTSEGATALGGRSTAVAPPIELTIVPGQTIPALLRIQRNGHADLVTFTVENLPHGVIVDNIGLNGVLIPKDQNERQVFLTAARWVPETDRLCFAVENQAGRQTSRPVLIRVRSAATRLSDGRP